jgi:hypothetical protein
VKAPICKAYDSSFFLAAPTATPTSPYQSTANPTYAWPGRLIHRGYMESDTIGALSDPPPCRKCGEQLTKSDWSISRDTRKNFKNCKVCREKVTSQKRKSRNTQVETRKQAKISFPNNNQGTSNNSIKEEDVSISEDDSVSPAEQRVEPSMQESDNEQWFDSPEKQGPSERQCSVCAESFPLQDFPSLCSCAHQPEVCQQCFLTYLDGRINDTVLEQIECPKSGCKNTIPHNDVKIYAPSDIFKK